MEKIKQKLRDLSSLIVDNISLKGELHLKENLTEVAQNLIITINSEILEEEKRRNLSVASLGSKEMVSHPSHYQGTKYECIDIMLDVFGKEKTLAFCELNAFKYLWRSDSKGTDTQDKKKAIWYLDKYNELKGE